MLIRVVRVYISSSVLANLGQGETASQVRPKGQKISKKKKQQHVYISVQHIH